MSEPAIPEGRLRKVISDGEEVVKLQCPQCGHWGEIDEDQLHGRVSVDHTDDPVCTFHETRNWAHTARWDG